MCVTVYHSESTDREGDKTLKTKSAQEWEDGINRRLKGRKQREKNTKDIKKPYLKIHLGEKPSGLPKVPQNKREMQMHLSGRHTDTFRDPVTRAERRAWDKWWKFKGVGYTKPERKGERFK